MKQRHPTRIIERQLCIIGSKSRKNEKTFYCRGTHQRVTKQPKTIGHSAMYFLTGPTAVYIERQAYTIIVVVIYYFFGQAQEPPFSRVLRLFRGQSGRPTHYVHRIISRFSYQTRSTLYISRSVRGMRTVGITYILYIHISEWLLLKWRKTTATDRQANYAHQQQLARYKLFLLPLVFSSNPSFFSRLLLRRFSYLCCISRFCVGRAADMRYGSIVRVHMV